MAKILLIDDELDIRDSVAAVLEREGFEVTTTKNAETGIQALSEQEFDLVISDIIMPGMDGAKAIRSIRDTNPNIRILAISGGGNLGPTSYQPDAITTTAYLQAATEAGANGILTKPFQRADIVNAVQQAMSDANQD
jgi:CheY-like chemotaxis protein